MLWSAVGELVCGCENAVEELLGSVSAVGLGEELLTRAVFSEEQVVELLDSFQPEMLITAHV